MASTFSGPNAPSILATIVEDGGTVKLTSADLGITYTFDGSDTDQVKVDRRDAKGTTTGKSTIAYIHLLPTIESLMYRLNFTEVTEV